MCKALYQPQLVGMLLIPKFRYVEPYLDKHADEVMMLVMILAECMNGVHKASVNILVVTLALLMCPRFNIRSTLENDCLWEVCLDDKQDYSQNITNSSRVAAQLGRQVCASAAPSYVSVRAQAAFPTADCANANHYSLARMPRHQIQVLCTDI